MDLNLDGKLHLNEEGLGLLQETISSVKIALEKLRSLQEYIKQTPREIFCLNHTCDNNSNRDSSNIAQTPESGETNNLEQFSENQNETISEGEIITNDLSQNNSYQPFINLLSASLPNWHIPEEIDQYNKLPESNSTTISTVEPCNGTPIEFTHDSINNCTPSTSQCSNLVTISCLDSEDFIVGQGTSNPVVEHQNSSTSPSENNRLQPLMNRNFRVFFTTIYNRLTENELKNVLEVHGFLYYFINIKNREDHSYGFITFSDLDSTKRAVDMSCKMFVMDCPIKIQPFRPFSQNNTKIGNPENTKQVSSQRNNKVNGKEIDENFLINTSSGYQMHRKVDLIPRHFTEEAQRNGRNSNEGSFLSSTASKSSTAENCNLQGSNTSKRTRPSRHSSKLKNINDSDNDNLLINITKEKPRLNRIGKPGKFNRYNGKRRREVRIKRNK